MGFLHLKPNSITKLFFGLFLGKDLLENANKAEAKKYQSPAPMTQRATIRMLNNTCSTTCMHTFTNDAFNDTSPLTFYSVSPRCFSCKTKGLNIIQMQNLSFFISSQVFASSCCYKHICTERPVLYVLSPLGNYREVLGSLDIKVFLFPFQNMWLAHLPGEALVLPPLMCGLPFSLP